MDGWLADHVVVVQRQDQGRRAAWDLVREIRTGGATVVLTTHFMDEADGDLNAATLGVLDGVRRVARDGERVII